MIPDASTWRSSADYDHLDALTASDMAWEWLRRNEDYDADFEAAASARGDPDPLTEQIRQRWGLRFPGRSSAAASRSTGSLASTGRHQRRRACRHPGGAR
nr:DUF6499 domain-containing protein [Paracoccus aminovorans]